MSQKLNSDLERSKKTNAYTLEVAFDQAGQRIDNFLSARLKGVPKSRIYKMLRTGEVRVNKGRVRASYKLISGDIVRVPPLRQSAEKNEQPGERLCALIEQCIVFESDTLLILNKPSGIAVHGGSGISHGVIEALRASRPQTHFLELVHRLDRDTSGCLLIAKKRSTLRLLHELFRGDDITKEYLALVKGAWVGGARKVDVALEKNTLRSGERVVRVNENGKSALSIFSPLKKYTQATLVKVILKTGRTHQIRVHAASFGAPVAGDDKYGDANFNKTMSQLGLKRLFLHAQHMAFKLSDSEKIDIVAPLSHELEAVLAQLETNDA